MRNGFDYNGTYFLGFDNACHQHLKNILNGAMFTGNGKFGTEMHAEMK